MKRYVIRYVSYICEEEKHQEFWKDLKQTTAEIFIFRDFKKFYRNPYSIIYFLTVIFITFIDRIHNKAVLIKKHKTSQPLMQMVL